MNDAVYTYYWWFKIIVCLLTFGFIYFFSPAPYLIYCEGGLDIHFWTVSIFLLVISLLMIGYTSYVMTYRLTIDSDIFYQYSIFGRKSMSREAWIRRQTLPSLVDTNRRSVSADLRISIFCNGYASIYREMDIFLHDTSVKAGISSLDRVPSPSAYAAIHRLGIIMALGLIPIVIYGFRQTLIAIDPPLDLLIYLSVGFLMSYIGYRCLRFDQKYLPPTLEHIKHAWILAWMVWNLFHTIGLTFRYSHESYTFFAAGGLCLVLLISYSIGNRLIASILVPRKKPFSITFLLCLPVVFFNILILVNTLSSGQASRQVHTTVDIKYPKIRPSREGTIGVSIGNRDRKTGLFIPSNAYDNIQQGDTVIIDIQRGLLGIQWFKTSYLHNGGVEFKYKAKKSEINPYLFFDLP